MSIWIWKRESEVIQEGVQEGNSVFILQSQKLKETIDDIVNQPYEFLKVYKYCRQVDFLLEIKGLSNIKKYYSM